jgi:hypothetical protein
MLFSALLMLFMFGIWINATQNISSLLDSETDNLELVQEADAEPKEKEENKKNKQEKELDDFNYLTFIHSFIAVVLSSPEANYNFQCSDLYNSVFTPPPQFFAVIL